MTGERRRVDDLRLDCQQLEKLDPINVGELAGQLVFDAVILVQNGSRNQQLNFSILPPEQNAVRRACKEYSRDESIGIEDDSHF